MELHETNALKVFEHVTEKGISIDQYNNKQLETLLLWCGIHKSKQGRLVEKKNNRTRKGEVSHHGWGPHEPL